MQRNGMKRQDFNVGTLFRLFFKAFQFFKAIIETFKNTNKSLKFSRACCFMRIYKVELDKMVKTEKQRGDALKMKIPPPMPGPIDLKKAIFQ